MSGSLNQSRPSSSRKQKQQQHKLKKAKSSTPVRRRRRQASQLAFSANHDGSTLHSILQSLLTLYFLLTLTLGVVVPISDALAKPVEHADYRQLFYLYMHIVGIAAVVYMNTLISCFGSTSRSKNSDSQQEPCYSGVTTVTTVKYFPPISGAAAEGDGAVTADAEPPAVSPGDEVSPEARAATSDFECAESQQRRQSLFQRVGGRFRKRLKLARPRSLLRRRLRYWNKERHCSNNSDDASMSSDQWKILWSAVGVNLYLRFGAIVFGFGVMAHTGFKIVDVLRKRGSENCVGPWFLPKHVVDLLFIVLQTYFIFKHHKVTINTQRSLVRFFLIHLAVTNLCIWIKTVIYEIKSGLMHSTVKKLHRSIASAVNFTAASYGQYASTAKLANTSDLIGVDRLLAVAVNASASRRNDTSSESSCVGRQVIDKESPSVKLGPYLYPCAVEYGLICAAICYKFFTNVGNTEGATPRAGLKTPEVTGSGSTIPRTTTCHKSHRGLFSGLIITICVLVPMVSLLITQQSNHEHKDLHVIAMLVIETLVLACTTVVAMFGAANVIRRLTLFKLERHEAFDVNLLFVGLAGIVCYSLFVAISVGACMMTSPTDQHAGCQWGSTRQAQITQLTGLKALADLTQSVIQTLFIMQAIQRKITRTLAERMQKPGRGITAALLIANLAMWIASVFEFQRDVGQGFLEYYFGFMPWSIIQLIFQPLIIFYRFHSTVCLSEIWVHSYKLTSVHEHRESSRISNRVPRRKVLSFKT